MKRFLLAAFLLSSSIGFTACASSAGKQRATADFTGAWSIDLCNEADPKIPCGAFDLYLHQDNDGRICGEHFVATPGLGRLDESDPATVLGTVSQGVAVVVIRSTRNDALYMARLSLIGDRLHWERVGMIVKGVNDEPPIIPGIKTLARARVKEKLQYQQDIVSSPCEWPEWGP
ncbi:MAG: hypothetical protein E6Q50_16545 [Lysobacter sp.]|nr:MAG: hypothetical protein E6Q50_16545 [Lysobacter sp.]